MALPYTFASQTAPTLAALDLNYAALGALTAIPCTVTGTDALTLTPAANTPAIGAYANYMPFTCVVANDNTGTVTAQIGALASLNVYKDTVSGPAALVAGDLQQSNFLTLTYDSALNSGSGGFHAESAPIIAGQYLPLTGGTLTGPLIGTAVTLSGLFSGNSATFSGAASVGTLNIAAGNRMNRFWSSTYSLVFGDIPPTDSVLQSVALGGASIGDLVMLSVPAVAASIAGLTFDAYLADTAVVAVKASNMTASTITPAGGTYRVGTMGVA